MAGRGKELVRVYYTKTPSCVPPLNLALRNMTESVRKHKLSPYLTVIPMTTSQSLMKCLGKSKTPFLCIDHR